MLEKTLESPLNCWEFKPVNPKLNQSWLFIGRTDGEAEYFGHLMWRTNSLERALILGNIEDKRRRGAAEDEIDSIINTVNMNLSKLQEIVGNAEVYGVPMSWTRFRDWTTAKIDIYNCKNSTNNTKPLIRKNSSSCVHVCSPLSFFFLCLHVCVYMQEMLNKASESSEYFLFSVR